MIRGVSAGLAGAADLLVGDIEFVVAVEVRDAVGVLSSVAASSSAGVVVCIGLAGAGCVAGCALGTDAVGFWGAG